MNAQYLQQLFLMINHVTDYKSQKGPTDIVQPGKVIRIN